MYGKRKFLTRHNSRTDTQKIQNLKFSDANTIEYQIQVFLFNWITSGNHIDVILSKNFKLIFYIYIK